MEEIIDKLITNFLGEADKKLIQRFRYLSVARKLKMRPVDLT